MAALFKEEEMRRQGVFWLASPENHCEAAGERFFQIAQHCLAVSGAVTTLLAATDKKQAYSSTIMQPESLCLTGFCVTLIFCFTTILLKKRFMGYKLG